MRPERRPGAVEIIALGHDVRNGSRVPFGQRHPMLDMPVPTLRVRRAVLACAYRCSKYPNEPTNRRTAVYELKGQQQTNPNERLCDLKPRARYLAQQFMLDRAQFLGMTAQILGFARARQGPFRSIDESRSSGHNV